MNREELIKIWLEEEERVFIGWDFSSLVQRTIEDPLPWDYKQIVQEHLKSTDCLLDMGTGGGEFLLKLKHPFKQTFATEGYLPNIELCRERLSPLGIVVKQVNDDGILDYKDESMDIIINRHEYYNLKEVNRVLKPGGIFITQQVGGDNNIALSNFLCKQSQRQVDDINSLQGQINAFEDSGFTVIESNEAYPVIRFLDTGALVYFAKIIEWEFIDFSVMSCLESLFEVDRTIAQHGFIPSKEHRYIIVSQKNSEKDSM